MGSRTIQLAVFVVLGVGIGLLITRPWRGDSAAESVESAPERSVPQVSATANPEPPPPKRTFNLPAMRLASAPTVAIQTKEETAEKRAPPALVPKDWLLRGSGPEHYDVRSDKTEVMSGQMSVLIAVREKKPPPTLFASLMQSVVA
jgi:hypothetical protein